MKAHVGAGMCSCLIGNLIGGELLTQAKLLQLARQMGRTMPTGVFEDGRWAGCSTCLHTLVLPWDLQAHCRYGFSTVLCCTVLWVRSAGR